MSSEQLAPKRHAQRRIRRSRPARRAPGRGRCASRIWAWVIMGTSLTEEPGACQGKIRTGRWRVVERSLRGRAGRRCAVSATHPRNPWLTRAERPETDVGITSVFCRYRVGALQPRRPLLMRRTVPSRLWGRRLRREHFQPGDETGGLRGALLLHSRACTPSTAKRGRPIWPDLFHHQAGKTSGGGSRRRRRGAEPPATVCVSPSGDGGRAPRYRPCVA